MLGALYFFKSIEVFFAMKFGFSVETTTYFTRTEYYDAQRTAHPNLPLPLEEGIRPYRPNGMAAGTNFYYTHIAEIRKSR